VTQGEKRATEWSAEQLPAWVPDGLASLLRKWPDAARVTAAELDAGAVAPADVVIDFCASELRPDILMLGSRPRSLLQRAFVSSVSSYVVRAHVRRARARTHHS
jgi:nucleotide-binding universal stress UspA family protein